MQLIPLLQTGATVGQRTTLVAADPLASFAAAFDKLAAADGAKMTPRDVETPVRSDTAPTVSPEDDPTGAKTLPVDVEGAEAEDSLDSPPMHLGLEPPNQQTKTKADIPLRPGSESRLIYAVRFDSVPQSPGDAAASDTGSGGAVALPAHSAKARPIVAHRESAELMMRPVDHRANTPQIAAPAAVRRPSQIAVVVEGMATVPATATATDMRETATESEKTAPAMRFTATIPADGLDRADNKPVSDAEPAPLLGSTPSPSRTVATAADTAIRVNATPAHGDGVSASAARQQPAPIQGHLPTHGPAVHQSTALTAQAASIPIDGRLKTQQQTAVATVIIQTMTSPAQTADVVPPTTANPIAPRPTSGTVQPAVARNSSEPRLAPTQPLTAVPAVNALTDPASLEGQIETALADIRAPGPTSVQSHIPMAQAAPQHLHATVAKQIADAAQNSSDRQIELTLSPAELGKVRMSLSSTDAGVSVLIHADRPETLDLMRRNIGDLESEFADMGYGDVDFAFSGGDSAHDQRGDHPQAHDTSTHADAPVVGTASNVAEDTPLSPETSMDIRI